MKKTFREELERLAIHFERVEASGDSHLFCDLLSMWMGFEMTERKWRSFYQTRAVEALNDRQWNGTDLDATAVEASEWDVFPDDQCLARFHGNLSEYERFQELAAAAYCLLCESDPDLDSSLSYYGWLDTISTICQYCPTSNVRCKYGLWGYSREADSLAFGSLTNLTEEIDGYQILSYPTWTTFEANVFSLSASALRMFIEPLTERFAYVGYGDLPILRPWQIAVVAEND